MAVSQEDGLPVPEDAVVTQERLDSFADVLGDFLHCFALGTAAWQSRNLGPVASLFRLMNDRLDLHTLRPCYYSLRWKREIA